MEIIKSLPVNSQYQVPTSIKTTACIHYEDMINAPNAGPEVFFC